MECLNKSCTSNINNKCIKKGEFVCGIRRIKTPTYAEEQLENAQDKENRCYNKECQHIKDNQCYILKTNSCSSYLKQPINYEEENNKLIKENEEIKAQNERLVKENSQLEEQSDKTYNNNIRLIELNEGSKERNKLLEERYKEQEERIEMQKTTIIELKEQIGEILSSGDKAFEELKKRMETERAEQDEIYKNVSIDRDKLINENKDLKKEIENRANQCSICTKDFDTKDMEVKRLGKSTNENYYKWIEEQKENIKLTKENEENKNKIDTLKRVIKDLNELI